MSIPTMKLKKGEERRLRAGHVWIYSNEINTASTPLKNFSPGEEVIVAAQDNSILGVAYINPHSLITARLLSTDSRTRLDQAFLIQRLQLALALRERLFPKPYYRLVFGEADGLPGLVVDRFADTLVMQLNTAGMDVKKDLIVAALREILPTVTTILCRNDSSIRKQEGLEQYVAPAFGLPPESITLEENNVAFTIPLWQGQKTGWFYDHRLNRARLKEYVAKRRVLDVFSYAGAWAIQAARYQASHVDCIEASAAAAEWIVKNAELNQVQDKVKVICEDAFVAMKSLIQAKQQYDVIVLDPPAFMKKQKDRQEGLRAYQRLNELAIKLLVPGGILMSCSCSMHMSAEDMPKMLQRAAVATRQHLQILERGHQGPDHPIHPAIPETDYLKMVVARKI